MEIETQSQVVSTDDEVTQGQIEIQAGPAHILSLLVVLGAAAFAVGLGWWTLSDTVNVAELRATLLAEPGEVGPAAAQVVPRPALATVPAARQQAPQVEPRQMGLPPVRTGFKPAPETSSVKGDPGAPVTIIEFSDYQ
jgi:hypothetical protein